MATVEQTMIKVQRLLTGPLGLRVELQGDAIIVRFAEVSTQVRFVVREFGTDQQGEPLTVVGVSSAILFEVTPTPELYEWVAREGGAYYFGHVTVWDDPDGGGKVMLIMTHNLLGDYLDEEELRAAMWGVLSIADRLDDQLQPRFGGKRLADL